MNTKLKTAMPGRLWICAAGMLAIVALVVGLFASQGMARADESATETLTVTKVWKDAEGKDAAWPEGKSVTIELLLDGQPIDEAKAQELGIAKENLSKTLASSEPVTFEGLPYNESVKYSVREVEKEGVTKDYNSTVQTIVDRELNREKAVYESAIIITNTPKAPEPEPEPVNNTLKAAAEQETIDITVEKKWVNADGSDTWPVGDTVEVQLIDDEDPEAAVKSATLSETQPSCTFVGLPKYKDKDGTPTQISYSVKEIAITGYATTSKEVIDEEGNYSITITNTKAIDVTVEKKWVNADGTDTWPKGKTVEVQLIDDEDPEVAVKSATLSETQPSCTFVGLPKYKDKDGTPTQISYSVKEIAITGYATTSKEVIDEEGNYSITITNTETVNLQIKKTVTGDTSDSSYNKNEEFSFTLAKVDKDGKARTDGSDMLPSSVTAKAKAGETATFDGITYTEPDTYYYTITEAKGTTSGMTYDDKARYAKVVVDKDETSGKLVIKSVTYSTTTSEDNYKTEVLTVTNTFKAASTPTTSAKTGDALPIVAVLVVVLISGACVVVALVRRKKQQD